LLPSAAEILCRVFGELKDGHRLHPKDRKGRAPLEDPFEIGCLLSRDGRFDGPNLVPKAT